jgi:hypothetical protein
MRKLIACQPKFVVSTTLRSFEWAGTTLTGTIVGTIAERFRGLHRFTVSHRAERGSLSPFRPSIDVQPSGHPFRT